MSTHPSQAWYILGAGAIGGLWAHTLQTWGLDVTILARSEEQHLALQHQGLQVTQGNETNRSHPKSLFPGLGQDTIQNLLVCTKTYATVAAIRTWRKLLHPQANIVLLQNGMGTAHALQAELPQSNIYCATTTDGAWRRAPWQIVRAGQGITQIGAFSAHLNLRVPPPSLANIIALGKQHAGTLNLQWHEDIITPMWHKLAINSVINALTAIYKVTNGALIDHPQGRPRLDQLCQETENVMSRCHITPIPHGLLQQALRVLKQTADNKSSMLQDCLAGQPSELDAINGFVIQQGAILHLPCAAHKQVCSDLRAQYPTA